MSKFFSSCWHRAKRRVWILADFDDDFLKFHSKHERLWFSRQKFTKNAFETARTFCTMFYERETRDILLHTDSLATLLMVIRQKARSLASAGHQMDMLEHAPGTGAHLQPHRLHFSAFQGLRENIRRRLKHYKSDFVDAFRDGKSIQKVISTTFFLYFACLLPTLAFGVLDDKATSGLIGNRFDSICIYLKELRKTFHWWFLIKDARKALIGQAIGGLVFAFFSGQPLVIIATTAPLCLYTKSRQQNENWFDSLTNLFFFPFGTSHHGNESPVWARFFCNVCIGRNIQWSIFDLVRHLWPQSVDEILYARNRRNFRYVHLFCFRPGCIQGRQSQ